MRKRDLPRSYDGLKDLPYATRAAQIKYNLTPGVIICKEFRGIIHEVIVNDDNTFMYNGEKVAGIRLKTKPRQILSGF